MKIHVVQKGDTLWEIAEHYHVSYDALIELNPQLSSPDMIMPGMKIKVPTTSKAVKTEHMKKTKPSVEKPYEDTSPKPKPVIKEDDHQKPKHVEPEMPLPKPMEKPNLNKQHMYMPPYAESPTEHQPKPKPPVQPQPMQQAMPCPPCPPVHHPGIMHHPMCMHCGQPQPMMPIQSHHAPYHGMNHGPAAPNMTPPMHQGDCGCQPGNDMPSWGHQQHPAYNHSSMRDVAQEQNQPIREVNMPASPGGYNLPGYQQQMPDMGNMGIWQPQQMQPTYPPQMLQNNMPTSPYPAPPGYPVQYEYPDEDESSRE